jgi:hypothetical protein
LLKTSPTANRNHRNQINQRTQLVILEEIEENSKKILLISREGIQGVQHRIDPLMISLIKKSKLPVINRLVNLETKLKRCLHLSHLILRTKMNHNKSEGRLLNLI